MKLTKSSYRVVALIKNDNTTKIKGFSPECILNKKKFYKKRALLGRFALKFDA